MMKDYRQIVRLAAEHTGSDPAKLMLKAPAEERDIMRQVVQQLEGMSEAATKWPFLADNPLIAYPPRLNREQSSSERAARFKSDVIGDAASLADLTGGMGIDSMAFAQRVGKVDYVEHDEELAALAAYNAEALTLSNLHCHCGDSLKWLEHNEDHFDWIYLDPARRDTQGHKVVAFEDCTPNILQHRKLLLSRTDHLMIKASPMVSIPAACNQLETVEQVIVVAVEHECKEVLFVVGKETEDIALRCVDLWKGGTWDVRFSMRQESEAVVQYSESIMKYLYEPNAALMKGGGYRYVAQRYGIAKLAPNTHLYTSDSLIEDFPGRTFIVEEEVPLNRKAVSQAFPEGKAHVVTRNYPQAAADLQKQVGLKEGGDHFLIATQTGTRKTGLRCSLVRGRMVK